MQLTHSGFGRLKAAEPAADVQAMGNWGWRAACAISVIPVAAILHHAYFYYTTCMLDSFGHEYTLEVVSRWLANDPSLPLAVLIALAGYQLGNRYRGLRMLLIPFLVAFVPLSLWVWDLPFTGRLICMNLHDGRMMLADGLPLKGRHLYVAGVIVYASLLVLQLRVGQAAPTREAQVARAGASA